MKLAHEEELTRASDESKNSKHIHFAVKVWSEVLQAHVWVVADEKDIELFTTYGLKGKIYTSDEIRELNCMDSNSLKALHSILFNN